MSAKRELQLKLALIDSLGSSHKEKAASLLAAGACTQTNCNENENYKAR